MNSQEVINKIIDKCYDNMSAVTNLPSTGMGQILISKDIENLFERADKHRKTIRWIVSSRTRAYFFLFFDENVLKSKETLEENGLIQNNWLAYEEIRGFKRSWLRISPRRHRFS